MHWKLKCKFAYELFLFFFLTYDPELFILISLFLATFITVDIHLVHYEEYIQKQEDLETSLIEVKIAIT